jgi:catechol 2,3-dioxygenase-like lactoylglutathione lyase family enzyme
MLTAVDHLIIAVPDLEAAVKSYTGLGFTVVPGGRHTGIGTYNALIAFQDTAYLELIAFYEPRPDHRWWAPLQQGGGLVDFCLQTDDLAGDAAALHGPAWTWRPQERHRRRPGVEALACTLARRPTAVAPFASRIGRDARVPGSAHTPTA